MSDDIKAMARVAVMQLARLGDSPDWQHIDGECSTLVDLIRAVVREELDGGSCANRGLDTRGGDADKVSEWAVAEHRKGLVPGPRPCGECDSLIGHLPTCPVQSPRCIGHRSEWVTALDEDGVPDKNADGFEYVICGICGRDKS